MKRLLGKNGFTLVELSIAIVFMAAAALITYSLTDLTVGIASTTLSSESLQAEASEACYRFSRDARSIRREGGLVTADGQDVRLVNNDGQEVRYWLEGTNLMRNNSILVEGVNNLQITYYDDIGTPIANPTTGWAAETDVRLFKLDITISQSGNSYSLQAKARPRNL